MSDQVTPAQLAWNDQILADVGSKLDSLIDVQRQARELPEVHPHVLIATFTSFLEANSDPNSLAFLLAVAIDRLARSQDGNGVPS